MVGASISVRLSLRVPHPGNDLMMSSVVIGVQCHDIVAAVEIGCVFKLINAGSFQHLGQVNLDSSSKSNAA